MSTSPAASETIAVSDSVALVHVNMTNVTKLTASNFLMWSRQVHALFDGYELFGYLDGSTEIPSPTLTADNIVSVNPNYTVWKRQDRLIYSALLGAITPSVQSLLSTTTTAAEIWTTLSSTYAKPSRGHFKQLKLQINQWTKGNKSINDYFQGLTTRFDQLALLGKAMDLEDQIEYLLQGLPEEYKTVVDQIEGRDSPPSLTEIHEKLINHEAKLQTALMPSSSTPVSANVATHRGSNNNNNFRRQNHSNNNRGNQTWQQQQQFQPHQDNYPPRGYQGRCQICGVHGHSARRCSQINLSGGFLGTQPRPQQPTSAPWQPRANLASTPTYNANNWVMDSGATHHLTTDLSNLSLHQPYLGGEEVTIADGTNLHISHTGSSQLPTLSKPLTLTDVLYVPDLKKNLISVYRLCNANRVSVEFFPASFQVKDLSTGARLLQGKTKDELYEWPVTPKPIFSLAASPTPKTDLSSWHSRLGHPSPLILQTLVAQFHLPLSLLQKQFACSDCLINKTHKLPFSTNTITSNHPLEYLYSDVWSSPLLSVDNYKYYLVNVDHYTRYTWLYPLKQKSQVREVFIAFKALVETKFQTKIRTLYSDNGGEFIGLRQFLTAHGISHLTSPPHTPEHNGISERKHRHIVETGLTLLGNSKMPKSYWPFAFSTAVYLINRLPTAVLGNESPYHKLFQQQPNYLKLRVFGCSCFPWLRPYTKHKLEDPTGRIYTSRHVTFDETTFPFSASENPTPNSPTDSPIAHAPATILTHRPPPLAPAPPQSLPESSSSRSSSHQSSSSSSDTPPSPGNIHNSDMGLDESQSPSSGPTTPTSHNNQTSPLPIPTNENDLSPIASSPSHETSEPIISPNPSPTSSSSSAASEQPPPPIENAHPMTTRAKNNITKLNHKFSLLTKRTTTPFIPTTVNQALRDPRWRNAMGDEFNALNRYKARFVARGFTQQQGIDYAETFSPVVKSDTIRVVLQLAVSNAWPIKQLDVNNAFLQGTLTDEVYVAQPPGFVDKDRPDHVCRLRKALYGLKQAPRAWYEELKSFLLSIGFCNSLADTSVFTRIHNGTKFYILVYVDDIIVTSSSQPLITKVIDTLSARFSLKEPTDLSYFLGIEAIRSPHGLHLMQKKYIIDLLAKTKMLDAKPVSTPLAPTPKLTLATGTPLPEPREYRMVFMHRPTDVHWQAAKRVLRYLAGTPSHGIYFRADSPDTHDYVSTNAYILFLGSTPIAWSSKKQKGVARSSTESEYRGVANTAAEIRWICSLLTELGITLPSVLVIYCDNVGVTYLCANPVFHSRMKHLALNYHFIRDNVQSGALRVTHLSTKDQLADALTKALPRPRFLELFSKIGVKEFPLS
ncbi:unnamed protein product [Microthlaspi erraticum]|uniref:Integrase catalytic domain-containing protein n=1 Tax=Microthlaspi erraticum TaxID=1685480 RepID=A0A6D2KMT9_9BRAS|nr:unnamed protein product [Microthlaspi erraticum]